MRFRAKPKFHFFQINFITATGERKSTYHQSENQYITPTRVARAAGALGLSVHLMPENVIYYGYMTEDEWENN